jgi:hypothetical protein
MISRIRLPDDYQLNSLKRRLIEFGGGGPVQSPGHALAQKTLHVPSL